jgi:hypothetical protein
LGATFVCAATALGFAAGAFSATVGFAGAGLRTVDCAARFAVGVFGAAAAFVAAAFGFLDAVLFAAGLRAGEDDLPFAAAGDLRAGFTCFLTMFILVR